MEQDSLITLNIERLIGTYGRVTVEWVANGSTSDVFPASGMVCNKICTRGSLTRLPQTICAGPKQGQHTSDCPVLLIYASQSLSVMLTVLTFGWHIIPQHHSCSSRTRCCNSVRAVEMCICSILFLSSVLPAVLSSYSVKSFAQMGIKELFAFLPDDNNTLESFSDLGEYHKSQFCLFLRRFRFLTVLKSSVLEQLELLIRLVVAFFKSSASTQWPSVKTQGPVSPGVAEEQHKPQLWEEG